MDFSKALKELKAGKRVARKGWSTKGMFLYFETFDYSKHLHVDGYMFEPCIVFRTSSGKWQPGWVAAQTDFMAEDWVTVD